MSRAQSNVDASLPRVVIVGAGFGGLKAATALRDAPVRVTIIDRGNAHVFQPLLYQVATADLSPADISAPIRGIVRHQKNAEVLMAEVTSIDTTARVVLADDKLNGRSQRIPYDYLVLATGAGLSYFGHDDWIKDAPGLKDLTDATSIRRRVLTGFEAAEMEPEPERRAAQMTFVLVGGGPTGVELAGAIADLSHRALARDFRHIDPTEARIILVEAGPRLLSAFPESLATAATRELERLGVEVRTGQAVERVTDDGVVVAGEHIAAHTVVWAAGVTASPAGRWLGVETDRAGRVLVSPELEVPGLLHVYAIGDTAHVEEGGKLLPGVAPVAMQQGTYVGKRIRAALAGETTDPFKYWDKGNLATIGRAYAIADFGRVRFTGLLGWLIWVAVHIFYLISFRNRLVVMMQWAWAYLTAQHGARLILGDQHETDELAQRALAMAERE